MIVQYAPEFGVEERQAVTDYMASGAWLTEHVETELFEAALADTVGVPYVSAVNNGTISLSLALLALGLKPGDRVVVPDLTMIATAFAVQLIGCVPVLCDVDPSDLCLDLERAIDRLLDSSAKAVIYVSLNGRSHSAADLIAFRGDLHSYNAYLVEDAAQSLGSYTPDGRPLGSLGDISSLSFSPHKIISTGQGGAILTSDPALHQRVERLKDFGRLTGGEDIHEHFGVNAKFTDLQAVVGLAQLGKLPQRVHQKLGLYNLYQGGLAGLSDYLMPMPHYSTPWFMEVYTVDDCRDELREYLTKHGIGTRTVYPALHTQRVRSRRCARRVVPSSVSVVREGAVATQLV